MRHKLTIDGGKYARRKKDNTRFCDFNDVAGRKWQEYARLKKRDQARLEEAIRAQLGGLVITGPIYVIFNFYEQKPDRDKDNISGWFHKVFFDALQAAGVIADDGWANVDGYEDHFGIDAQSPHITIYIEETEEQEWEI